MDGTHRAMQLVSEKSEKARVCNIGAANAKRNVFGGFGRVSRGSVNLFVSFSGELD